MPASSRRVNSQNNQLWYYENPGAAIQGVSFIRSLSAVV
jgi:hypothetical protein